MGAIGCVTTISALVITLFGWDIAKVTVIALCFVIAIFLFSVLIQKSENRTRKMMDEHEKRAESNNQEIKKCLETLEHLAVENQVDVLRVQLLMSIEYHPENHDSIIGMAERYFIELDGNWVMTEAFLSWVDRENNAGRKVYIPPQLLSAVKSKQ